MAARESKGNARSRLNASMASRPVEGEEEEEEDERVAAPATRTLEALRPPLRQRKKLRKLTLHAVGLQSTSGLAQAPPTLEELTLSANELTSVGEIGALPSLRCLDLSANKLRASPPLSNLPSLRSLALGALKPMVPESSPSLLNPWNSLHYSAQLHH